jgi:hypothetical protein
MRSINKTHYTILNDFESITFEHLQPKIKIYLFLFQGIASLSERVLYSEFV